MKAPGLSAPVEPKKSEQPNSSNNPGPSKPAETVAAPQKQADLKSLLDCVKHKEMVSDDFAAAFLQASILPNKLGNPWILGLFCKYRAVSGSIAKGDTLCRGVDCVHECRIGAIRKIARGKSKVGVGTDVWPGNQGHAIINILLGLGSRFFVVATDTCLSVWTTLHGGSACRDARTGVVP